MTPRLKFLSIFASTLALLGSACLPSDRGPPAQATSRPEPLAPAIMMERVFDCRQVYYSLSPDGAFLGELQPELSRVFAVEAALSGESIPARDRAIYTLDRRGFVWVGPRTLLQSERRDGHERGQWVQFGFDGQNLATQVGAVSSETPGPWRHDRSSFLPSGVDAIFNSAMTLDRIEYYINQTETTLLRRELIDGEIVYRGLMEVGDGFSLDQHYPINSAPGLAITQRFRRMESPAGSPVSPLLQFEHFFWTGGVPSRISTPGPSPLSPVYWWAVDPRLSEAGTLSLIVSSAGEDGRRQLVQHTFAEGEHVQQLIAGDDHYNIDHAGVAGAGFPVHWIGTGSAIPEYRALTETGEAILSAVALDIPYRLRQLTADHDGDRVVLERYSFEYGIERLLVDASTGRLVNLSNCVAWPASLGHAEYFQTTTDLGMMDGIAFDPEYPSEDRMLVVHLQGGPGTTTRLGFYTYLSPILQAGANILTVNYPGGGGRGEAWTRLLRGNFSEAANATCQAIQRHREELGDNVPVILYGESLGGGLSVSMAASQCEGVRGVILQSPSLDFMDIQQTPKNLTIGGGGSGQVSVSPNEVEVFGLYTDQATQQYWAEVAPAVLAERVNIPVLILHGRDDALVPVDQVRRFVNDVRSSGGQVRYIEGEYGHQYTRELVQLSFAEVPQFIEGMRGFTEWPGFYFANYEQSCLAGEPGVNGDCRLEDAPH